MYCGSTLYLVGVTMIEIIYAFFILSGVCAWGFIAYILIKLFWGEE